MGFNGPRLSLPLSLSLPSMRRDLQRSDLVVEEPSHGEPVQRLIASPADAAVVHISGHRHTQPLLAAPEENDNVVNSGYQTRTRECRSRMPSSIRGGIRKDFAAG